jgi:hypothetical protein
MEKSTMSELEKRIATALTSDVKATDLAALIVEVETAQADTEADTEREKALDVLVSPDASKARAAAEDAAFTRDRLRNVMPRLQQRQQKVAMAEEIARWLPQHDAAKARCDELAQRLRDIYVEFVDEFMPLVTEIEDADREIRRVNEALPNEGATGLYLRSVAEACGGNNLLKDLRLPAWQAGAAPLWPRQFNPALIAPVVAGDPRQSSGDWWRIKEEEARALRERQEREAADEQAKARANWRGPRWWLGERA